MKNSTKILTFFTLICLASVASADYSTALTTSSNLSSMFQIAPNDISVFVLMHIFGNVGQVLPGDYLLTGEIFQYFNIAVLSITVLIPVTWVVLRSVVETAHEGQFLGKKLHSVWVPIRISLAMALLAPVGGAYSFIQIVIMWGILQGIGAADSLWQISLQYFMVNGGFIYTSQTGSASYDLTPEYHVGGAVTVSGGNTVTYGQSEIEKSNQLGYQMLAGLMCMANAYKAKHKGMGYDDAPTLLPSKNYYTGQLLGSTQQVTWIDYNFSKPAGTDPKTGDDYTSLSKDCGNIYIPDYNKIKQKNSHGIWIPVTSGLVYDRALAMDNAVASALDNMAETAKYLVYNGTTDEDVSNAMSSMNSAASNPIAMAGSLINSSVYAASESAAEQAQWAAAGADNPYKIDYMYGWAYAGALYYNFLRNVKNTTSGPAGDNVSNFSTQVQAGYCSSDGCPFSPVTTTTGGGTDAYMAVCSYPKKSSTYGYIGSDGTVVANKQCSDLMPLYTNANSVMTLTASGTTNVPGSGTNTAATDPDSFSKDNPLKTASEVMWKTKFYPPAGDPVSAIFFPIIGTALQGAFTDLMSYSGTVGGLYTVYAGSLNYSAGSFNINTGLHVDTGMHGAPWDWSKPSASWNNAPSASLGNITMNAVSTPESPLVVAVKAGATILQALQVALTALAYGTMAMGLIAGICAAEQPAVYGLFGLLFVVLPIILLTMTTLYLVGFMLADYLPLVPFIIFFFATTGWVFAVVECIVAAPIAALGMTFPEGGHDLFGGAKAIMEFVISVCLTPVLIIIGFFVSIYAMFALVGLLNMLFGTALTYALTDHQNKALLTNFDQIFFLAIYTFMVVLTVHKCCTFGIEKMPVGVLRVLGFSGTGLREYMGGEAQVAGVAKQASETMGKGAESLPGEYKSFGEQWGKSIERGGKGGKGGGGGGGGGMFGGGSG